MFLHCSVLEDELPRANSTSALSGAGVLRLFNRVGETVNKITFKMDENDPVSITQIFSIFHLVKVRLLTLSVESPSIHSGLMKKLHKWRI